MKGKRKYIQILLGLLLCSIACSTSKQTVTGVVQIKEVMEGMVHAERATFIETIINPSIDCLEAYKQSMSLLDPENPELGVSRAAAHRFEDLFMSNAYVYDDVSENPSMVNVKDYVTNIVDALEQGVIIDMDANNFYTDENSIGNAIYRKNKADGSTTVERIIYKTISNAYTTDSQEKILEKGRTTKLKVVLYIPKNESKAYILNIVPIEPFKKKK